MRTVHGLCASLNASMFVLSFVCGCAYMYMRVDSKRVCCVILPLLDISGVFVNVCMRIDNIVFIAYAYGHYITIRMCICVSVYVYLCVRL